MRAQIIVVLSLFCFGACAYHCHAAGPACHRKTAHSACAAYWR